MNLPSFSQSAMLSTLAFFLLALLWMLPSKMVQAQSSSSNYLLKKMDEWIEDYEDNGYRLLRTEIGSLHSNSGRALSFRRLSVGKIYEIRVFSDENEVRDLDLKVLVQDGDGDKWNLEIMDRNDLPGARVNFEPSQYGLYRIEIEGFDIKDDIGRYSLLICMKKE